MYIGSGFDLPYSLFTQMRMVTAFLLTNASLVFRVVKPPLYQCSRRWIGMKPFSEGPPNTGAWIWFRILNHAKVLLCRRCHLWKLRNLAVDIGNLEIHCQFWISENLTFCWYRLYVDVLRGVLFYPQKCISHLWTLYTNNRIESIFRLLKYTHSYEFPSS